MITNLVTKTAVLHFLFTVILCLSYANAQTGEKSIATDIKGKQKYSIEKNDYFITIEKNVKMEKYAIAEGLLEEFKSKYPEKYKNERKYYYFYGVVNENKGEIINAVMDYQKAISLLPGYSQARNDLGVLYLKIGKYKESEEHLLKALKANLYSPFINYNTGDLYYKMQRYDLAVKYLENACKYKPNYGEAFNKLGIVRYYLRDYTEAMHMLNRGIEFQYASHETYYYLGLVYMKLNQIDLAISSFKKALEIKNDFTYCLIEMGKIHKTYKEYSIAIEYFRKAESIDFENPDIRYAIAECYYGMKRFDDAIEVIEKLMEVNPGNDNYEKLLSEIKKNKFTGNIFN
jgi:tetratricopeptide (TPR) repeat protein